MASLRIILSCENVIPAGTITRRQIGGFESLITAFS